MARNLRRAPGFGGCLVAVAFFCASLTPSLMPRGWVLQGVVGGITAAIGYGLGALLGRMARGLISWTPPPAARVWAWRALWIGSSAAVVIFLINGVNWQAELRRLMDVEQLPTWNFPLIVLIAAGICGIFVLIARVIRLGTRRVARLLGRYVSRKLAYALAVPVVTFVVFGLVQGFLLAALLEAVNAGASVSNSGTTPGIVRPHSRYVSGGRGSEVSWNKLGRMGRSFIGKTPSRQELADFAGRTARAPIRVYVGRHSAPTFRDQARIAVRELRRTGAFERKVLAVVTTTGTGWIDEAIARSVEYLHAGDTAVVGMQYSAIPSWLSFLVDRDEAVAAASALNEEVHAAWSELPEGERPRLIVVGESLGSYGIERSFGGDLGEMMRRTDGALLIGPPNINPIRTAVTAGRDPGSPPWRPIYHGGRHVRFAQWPGDFRLPKGPWRPPRVAYLANASDPVVWWDTELLYAEPAWLDPPRGPDVSRHMRWLLIVTFWQVSIDLVYAQDVPPGHGHEYGTTIAAAWAALVPPEGWTEADTRRLIAAVGDHLP